MIAASFIALIILMAVGPMLPSSSGETYPDVDGDIEADGDFSAPSFSGPWTLIDHNDSNKITGYASLSNVMPGNTLGLDISCTAPSMFKTDIFRMGYYGGQGALQTDHISYRHCYPQSGPIVNPTTGLIDTRWSQTIHLLVPENWQPGYYLARLTSLAGYQSYIPFLVSSPKVTSKYLFVDAINTSEAYNSWDGNSLYVGKAAAGRIDRAFKVSLNRPYSSNNGAGDFLDWEYPMAKYLEEYNFNVDYATDIQINADPSMLLKYKAIIITGHDEYWTWPMLAGYKSAIQHGVNLAVFAANTDYRPTRIQADPYSNQRDRVIVCYKDYHLDPSYEAYTKVLAKDQEQLQNLKDPPTVASYQVTGFNWRNAPFNMPESEILGEGMLGLTKNPAPLTVNDASNWIFAGTGLKNGDSLPGLVGYEYDSYNPQFPGPTNVSLLFSSKVGGDISNGTLYTATGGGQVFNAGTNQWSWGLDTSLSSYSPQLVVITSNILNGFGQ